MKRTICLYATLGGSTKSCAEEIARQLHCEIADLSNKVPDLIPYKRVILGSGIYMGSLPKKVRKFLKENEKILEDRELSIFVCCLNQNYLPYLQASVPQRLLERAETAWFGGVLRPERLKGLYRLIAKAAEKKNTSAEIEHARLANFIEEKKRDV